MDVCQCNATLSNTGKPSCAPIMDVAYKLLFVRQRNNDGVANQISLSSTFNQSLVDGWLNAANYDQRYYPTPGQLENTVDERADDEFQTFESGNKARLKSGVRTITVNLPNATPQDKANFDSMKCDLMSFLIIDKQGNLIGDTSVATYLQGIKIQKNTLETKYIRTTETSVPMLQIKFDVDQRFDDADMGMLLASDFTSVDLRECEGLIDLYGEAATSISTTGFTMKITSDYGSIKNKQGVAGLTATDIEVYNTTTAAAVTTTVSESTTTKGLYTFTFTAQTTADVLYVRKKSGSTGWADDSLITTTVTIP